MELQNWFLLSDTEVPNLEYICLSEGVHLGLAIKEKYIFTYLLIPNMHTYISEYFFKNPLYAYC